MAACFVTVEPNWSAPLATASTAATVEVDVMPHLARTPEGGSFAGYVSALSGLGATYVRFAPWFAYPKVVVPERRAAECGAGGRGAAWDSTLLDAITADFMLAVCGPRAASGMCEHGRVVVPQLSTMPAWMYEADGVNRTAMVPDDPWAYPSGRFDYYLVKGRPLRDSSCSEMAGYAARYVGWYTAGGMTDECGVRHESGLFYPWRLLSVLNEDEYHTPPGGGVQYTICFDAWKRAIATVNPHLRLVGPETAGGSHGTKGGMHARASEARDDASWRASLRGQLDYSRYFIDPANHQDLQPPPFVSNHVALYGPPYEQFFEGLDDWVNFVALPLDAARRRLAPNSTLVMNEFIPFVNDWCDTSSGSSCDWTRSDSNRTAMNRRTLGWSAAAASFAYAFGVLSEIGFGWVGADQLIGGVWPDNEPAVASLDWRTGEPTAKYWAVNMLASTLGHAPRRLYASTVEVQQAASHRRLGSAQPQDPHTLLYALPMQTDAASMRAECGLEPCDAQPGEGSKLLLLVSKTAQPMRVRVDGAGGAIAYILEGVGAEPGFSPPSWRRLDQAGHMELGPYGIALIRC